MLWRSAHPDDLDAAAWDELREAGITTVVDLRNPAERMRASDRLDGITVLARPLEDVDDPEYEGRWSRNWATPDFFAWGRDHWPNLWVAVLTAIGDAPEGVLIHCAAGRDRTGMVTALLLETAGVTRQAVLDGYERGIRESSHRDIDAYVDEYREALDRLLDALVPEPELIRAAERLRGTFPIGRSPDQKGGGIA